MCDKINGMKRNRYVGSGALTREQFLFHETRIVAGLMTEGLSDAEIFDKIYNENLFQFPTEKSVKTIMDACVRRLHALDNDILVQAIAGQPVEVAKQICLYAMMKQSTLMWDFMLTVIGGKFRQNDLSFSKKDVTVFLLGLQEQDDTVTKWSAATLVKIRQVIMKTLMDTEYIDNLNTTRLNMILLSRVLEVGIRENHDEAVFPAFNYFE